MYTSLIRVFIPRRDMLTHVSWTYLHPRGHRLPIFHTAPYHTLYLSHCLPRLGPPQFELRHAEEPHAELSYLKFPRGTQHLDHPLAHVESTNATFILHTPALNASVVPGFSRSVPAPHAAHSARGITIASPKHVSSKPPLLPQPIKRF